MLFSNFVVPEFGPAPQYVGAMFAPWHGTSARGPSRRSTGSAT